MRVVNLAGADGFEIFELTQAGPKMIESRASFSRRDARLRGIGCSAVGSVEMNVDAH